MPAFNEKELLRLPVLARVSLALIAAERVADILSSKLEAQVLVIQALDDAWKWEAKGGVSARQLYGHIHPLIACEWQSEIADEHEKAALFSAIMAVYYTTWHARKLEVKRGVEVDRHLPNDIADITELTLLECLQYAAAAKGRNESEWQFRAVQRLLAVHNTADPDSLGVPLLQPFFEGV